MALIVGVHGIAQEFKGAAVLQNEWEPSLRDGVALAGGSLPRGALACATYGKLFRPSGNLRGSEDLSADEVLFLSMLLAEAERAEPKNFPPSDARVRGGVPLGIQKVLLRLCDSSFLVGMATNVFTGSLTQVIRYMKEPETREEAKSAVHKVVTEDTCVLLGHSLGSVVAYEALHTYGGKPNWANVKTFITLGSPLGIPNLIFDALEPKPLNGEGRWPPGISKWTNVSDDGDIVALEKKLATRFGAKLIDYRVRNGARIHAIDPYLTAKETGEAVLHGIT